MKKKDAKGHDTESVVKDDQGFVASVDAQEKGKDSLNEMNSPSDGEEVTSKFRVGLGEEEKEEKHNFHEKEHGTMG